VFRYTNKGFFETVEDLSHSSYTKRKQLLMFYPVTLLDIQSSLFTNSFQIDNQQLHQSTVTRRTPKY